eukprot:1479920-Prymnesium_polylepis.1
MGNLLKGLHATRMCACRGCERRGLRIPAMGRDSTAHATSPAAQARSRAHRSTHARALCKCRSHFAQSGSAGCEACGARAGT